MSAPGFDWGAMVEGVLGAIGSLFNGIVSAIQSNANVIGNIFGAMIVAITAFSLLTKVPFVSRITEWIGGLFR